MIDEDPVPPMASVNIAATDLKAVLNAKNDGRLSPNARIRKVWIPIQYLVHKDELEVKRRMSTAKENEKNGKYPYHSKQEIKKEKSSKGKNVPLKEKHIFSKINGVNTLRRKIPPRFVVPPPVSPGQEWHVVQHRKFPQKLTITQKRRMQKQRAMEKRQLNEVPKEAPKKKTKESEKLKKEAMPSPRKTKFGKIAIEDAKSICNSDKETDSGIILIGTIPISLNCSTSSLTLPTFFKSKEMEKSLVEVKEKQSTVDEGVTIKPSKGSRP